jgi:hypothetical protein
MNKDRLTSKESKELSAIVGKLGARKALYILQNWYKNNERFLSNGTEKR